MIRSHPIPGKYLHGNMCRKEGPIQISGDVEGIRTVEASLILKMKSNRNSFNEYKLVVTANSVRSQLLPNNNTPYRQT